MARARVLALLILSLILTHGTGFAQDEAGSGRQSAAKRVSPAPVISYTLPPDKLEKSRALYLLYGRLEIGEFCFSCAVLLAMLWFGIAAAYRNRAEAVSRYSFVQAAIFVPIFLLTISVLELPLHMYGHHISLQYGLSVQRWGSWFVDWSKEQAISLVLAIPLLWLLVVQIRRSPRRWWFYFWLEAMPILLFVVFISPMVIEPMFNRFEPLEKDHADLAQSIERVVQKAGLNIPTSRMYEMKASEKTTELNAYVTGFGASKRVVIWDTTIQKLTVPETLFVFGHEMGHYVLRHIVKGMVAGAIGLLIVLYIIYRAVSWLQTRYGERWRIRELGDWAALPLLFLLFVVIGFLSDPIANGFSRRIEHQADVYGLEVTHGINADSQIVAAHAFQVLGEISLDYPYPSRLAVWWFYDHPPIADRIRFAQQYDPWERGKTPLYVK